MQPTGLEGPHAPCRRPLLRLLLLLLPLLTRAQSLPGPPGAPNATTTHGASSALGLRERAQALMRNFPLVDGYVDTAYGVGK